MPCTSSPTATTTPDRQAASALAGMIRPRVRLGLVVDRLDQHEVVERLDAAVAAARGVLEALQGVVAVHGSRIPAGRMARDMRSHEIRRRFVDHFTATGHVQLPSGSLVPPAWDQSVLITTAGMQPLKRYFLGQEEPPNKRLVTVQKCFRTVDIDEVGRTAHHLTFFEMLGNFSIGDYFKEFAVEQAWAARHLARRLRLRPRPAVGDRLPRRREGAGRRGGRRAVARASACRRSGSCGSAATTSGRPGPVGPCGPCSELHYDRGPEFGVRPARLRARLRLRPLHRVLEPRVHAVQHARRRVARAAAHAEHRHRRGARAGDDARRRASTAST